MAATAAPFSPWPRIAVWLVLQLSTQVLRLWLVARYRRIPADDDGTRLETAAQLNTLYMLIAGVVWGSTAFLFMHTAQPITVALTLCGLYGISGGSVPGNAYNPVGLFAFIGAIFGLVMLRMLSIGEYSYTVLGLASIGYSGHPGRCSPGAEPRAARGLRDPFREPAPAGRTGGREGGGGSRARPGGEGQPRQVATAGRRQPRSAPTLARAVAVLRLPAIPGVGRPGQGGRGAHPGQCRGDGKAVQRPAGHLAAGGRSRGKPPRAGLLSGPVRPAGRLLRSGGRAAGPGAAVPRHRPVDRLRRHR